MIASEADVEGADLDGARTDGTGEPNGARAGKAGEAPSCWSELSRARLSLTGLAGEIGQKRRRELEALDKQLGALRGATSEAAKRSCAALEQKKAELALEVDQLSRLEEGLVALAEPLEEAQKSAAEEAGRLRTSLEREIAATIEARAALRKKQGELGELEAVLAQQTGEMDAFRVALEQQEEESASLRERVRELEGALEESQKGASDLEQRASDLEQRASDLEQRASDLERELEQTTVERDRLFEELQRRSETVAELERVVAVLSGGDPGALSSPAPEAAVVAEEAAPRPAPIEDVYDTDLALGEDEPTTRTGSLEPAPVEPAPVEPAAEPAPDEPASGMAEPAAAGPVWVDPAAAEPAAASAVTEPASAVTEPTAAESDVAESDVAETAATDAAETDVAETDAAETAAAETDAAVAAEPVAAEPVAAEPVASGGEANQDEVSFAELAEAPPPAVAEPEPAEDAPAPDAPEESTLHLLRPAETAVVALPGATPGPETLDIDMTVDLPEAAAAQGKSGAKEPDDAPAEAPVDLDGDERARGVDPWEALADPVPPAAPASGDTEPAPEPDAASADAAPASKAFESDSDIVDLAWINDQLRSYVGDEAPREGAQPNAAGGDALPKAALIQATARISEARNLTKEEVRLASLVAHQPYTVEEIARILSLELDVARGRLSTFLEKGWVEIRG